MSIVLRANDLQVAYAGDIAGQRVLSSLPFAFCETAFCKADFSQSSFSCMERELSQAETVIAELEGVQVEMRVQHLSQSKQVLGQMPMSADAEPPYSIIKCVAQGVSIAVSGDGKEVWLWQRGFAANLLTWLLGPGLILALSRHGKLFLHASAIAFPSRESAVLLLGDSGVGKSTLARVCLELGGRRLTDDVSPIGIHDGQMVLFPKFPQLKLKTGELDSQLPSRIPIAAVVQLATPSARTDVTPISSDLDFMRVMLSHSIATRIFSRTDHANVLALASALVEQVGHRFRATMRSDFKVESAAEELLVSIQNRLP